MVSTLYELKIKKKKLCKKMNIGTHIYGCNGLQNKGTIGPTVLRCIAQASKWLVSQQEYSNKKSCNVPVWSLKNVKILLSVQLSVDRRMVQPVLVVLVHERRFLPHSFTNAVFLQRFHDMWYQSNKLHRLTIRQFSDLVRRRRDIP